MSTAGLDGRVAVVTGALGRLGPLWCETLAGAGMVVAGIDLHEGEAGSCARLDVADVTEPAAVRRVADTILAELGPPHVLVNNAGIDAPPDAGARTYRFEDIPANVFRRTIDVNLAGTFIVTQAFGSAMRDAGRGSIVNIGSLYATIGAEPSFYDHFDADPPFLKPPAYGASKAGVVNLTRYLARLWGPQGVRVNVLSPGGVEGGQDEGFLAKYRARVPLGRMARPSDLGGPLLFLASDASSYLTGHELRVDGGFTA